LPTPFPVFSPPFSCAALFFGAAMMIPDQRVGNPL
jgi:hypothetical protein